MSPSIKDSNLIDTALSLSRALVFEVCVVRHVPARHGTGDAGRDPGDDKPRGDGADIDVAGRHQLRRRPAAVDT